jgi:hypothetical protein
MCAQAMLGHRFLSNVKQLNRHEIRSFASSCSTMRLSAGQLWLTPWGAPPNSLALVAKAGFAALQVWTASQAPKVQELMTSLGFGSIGDTPSDAKAMLRESIQDGEIVYTPHHNLKKLPAAQRQAAKAGPIVMAAHMKRSDKQHIGAVWGYGWGPDRESAEVMAAEAAVANMYVCGVGFKQLPPYDGPGPQ